MLKTPPEHLPIGYPLPTPEESQKFERIWRRAFEIHAVAHDFDRVKTFRENGITYHNGPRQGCLSIDEKEITYCDCYERAYREFKRIHEEMGDIFDREGQPMMVHGRRRIQLHGDTDVH